MCLLSFIPKEMKYLRAGGGVNMEGARLRRRAPTRERYNSLQVEEDPFSQLLPHVCSHLRVSVNI